MELPDDLISTSLTGSSSQWLFSKDILRAEYYQRWMGKRSRAEKWIF